MELLDRYLRHVRALLPQAQRDDIVLELSENILSQVEDKEAELGRPLNEGEQEEIIERIGDPTLVASRYRQDHRSVAFGRELIGPVLFPFYTRVLSINMGLTALVCLLIALVLHGPERLPETLLPATLMPLLIQFSIVTAIFTAAQSHVTRFPNAWKSRGPGPSSGAPAEEEPRETSRFESFCELVILTVFFLWLRAVHSLPNVMGSGPGDPLLAPVWHQVYLPVLLFTAAGMAKAGIMLARPDWTRFGAIARAAIDGAGLVICGVLLEAGAWILPAGPGPDPTGRLRHGVHVINRIFFYSLLISAFFCALQFLWDLVRLSGRGSRPLAWLAKAKLVS